MIVETRFAAGLFILTAGGLLLSASRYKSNSLSQPIAFDILNQIPDEPTQHHGEDTYNYCQAERPTLEAYPDPKVRGATLVNAQLFVRHGDRTPATVNPRDLDLTWDCDNTTAYAFTGFGTGAEKAPFQHANVVAHQIITIPPTSPFASTHMWKGTCIPGQLTPVGAMQHRRLGAALRQIYVDKFKLLPVNFDPELVYVRSTDYWRTRQSAENLMAGMFGISRSSPDVPPPVLHIHTLPDEIEYLTMNTDACPQLSHLKYVVQSNSPVLKRLREENAGFLKELDEILGISGLPLSAYMDTVLPRVCHGYPLPCHRTDKGDAKCLTSTSVAKIMDLVGTESNEEYRDAKGVFEVLRLGIGPLVGDIKQNLLLAKANGKVRLSSYSGHDTTLSPLLGVFDSVDVRWPPYASNMLIELWKTPHNEYFVRVIYNGAVVQTKSQWCDLEWCPLETFIEYLDRFIVTDVAAMCQRK
ncbi:MAG: histidine phosphatase superfamily [Benniella sp.]|nr:MAG: histidine phosphatase superfamily [Benniella sp.]